MASRFRARYNIAHQLVCREHNEHGAILCCPFPNCKNGTEADEIVTAPPLLSDSVYRRAAWTGAEGGISYTWQGDLPLWFSIPRVLWREAVRLGFVPPFNQSASTIYQYTSVSGFVGIIESGELWLSNYAYLNDTSELRHGLSLVQRSFEAAAKQRSSAAVVLRALGRTTVTQQHRVCVASFSFDGDNLSQWRSYGPIAVGFEPQPSAFGYSNTSVMREVIYDSATQRRLLDLMAQLTASAWERDRNESPDKVDTLYRDGSDLVLDLVAFFKDQRFVDEREVRIVHAANVELMSARGVTQPPYRFRVTDQLIVRKRHGATTLTIPL